MTTSSDAEAVSKTADVMTVVDVVILVKVLEMHEAAFVEAIHGRAATSRSAVATTSSESVAHTLEAISETATASGRSEVSNPVAVEARLAANLVASYVVVTILHLPVRVVDVTPLASSQWRGSHRRRATSAALRTSSAMTALWASSTST